jgi:TonB family protein
VRERLALYAEGAEIVLTRQSQKNTFETQRSELRAFSVLSRSRTLYFARLLKLLHLAFLALILFFVSSSFTDVKASQTIRPIKVAVLDFGGTVTGRRSTEKIAKLLAANSGIKLLDRDESGPAAMGVGYAGSLNLTLEEARDLGAAIGCEFYLTGDAQTLRRSTSSRPVFYESYASIFVVSARTGRLLSWDRPSFEATSAAEAENLLIAELPNRLSRYSDVIRNAFESERTERELSVTKHAPVIEEVPDEKSSQATGLRLPQPYRRLRPVYPETAARAEVEATVDVLVDLDIEGEVVRVEIVRWAGFGLDEETVNTIRRMHFRPAMRDGVPLPMRVLLRYNFARPKKETS